MIVYRFKVVSGRLKRLCKCAEARARASAQVVHVVRLPGVEMRLFYLNEQATPDDAYALANRAIAGELPGVDLL